jgi:hypothetical protein
VGTTIAASAPATAEVTAAAAKPAPPVPRMLAPAMLEIGRAERCAEFVERGHDA